MRTRLANGTLPHDMSSSNTCWGKPQAAVAASVPPVTSSLLHNSATDSFSRPQVQQLLQVTQGQHESDLTHTRRHYQVPLSATVRHSHQAPGASRIRSISTHQRVLSASTATVGLVAGQFVAEAEIGRGAYGTVFVGRSLLCPQYRVAIKVESRKTPTQQLVLEFTVLQFVSVGMLMHGWQQHPSPVPFAIACEYNADWTFMVMELKGISLHQHFRAQRKFSF